MSDSYFLLVCSVNTAIFQDFLNLISITIRKKAHIFDRILIDIISVIIKEVSHI